MVDLKSYIDYDLYMWLQMIPNKHIFFDKLDKELCVAYSNITDKNYIISFDIEFLNYINNKKKYEKYTTNTFRNTKALKIIREMGGIVFSKYENDWYLIAFFHFNIDTKINKSKIFLLTHEYSTINDDTINKVIKLEEKLLPHYKYINQNTYDNLFLKSKKEIFHELYSNNLIKLFISKKKINNLINENNYNKFIKTLKKITFLINGYILEKNNLLDELNSFNKINELILNDEAHNTRYIDKLHLTGFLKLLNKIFLNSYLITKGIEDFKAIKNHSILFNINIDASLYSYYDIAKHNEKIFNLCKTAELKSSFDCLTTKKLTDKYYIFYEKLKKFIKIKAHNPLVDALFTLILFNIFINDDF
jgi:hypothetical protein